MKIARLSFQKKFLYCLVMNIDTTAINQSQHSTLLAHARKVKLPLPEGGILYA